MKYSDKGAAQFKTEDGRIGWMKPAQAVKYFDEGKATPAVLKAAEAAKTPETIDEDRKNKRPFRLVKFSEHIETDKAIKIRCFDGSGGWLPKSQIREAHDGIYVPTWLVDKNDLQAKMEVKWFSV